MRRHRLDRRQRKKRKKIIIFSMAGIICFFSVGYATFSQNFLVSGKGTVIQKGIIPNELKTIAVTSGDGLYKDTYEEGRYIYKGTNPNNYITFNSETWRITSVEKDGTMKIIKEDVIVSSFPFDPGYATEIAGVTSGNSVLGTRYSDSSNDYCYASSPTSYVGCNAWAATSNLVGTPNQFVNGSISGVVSSDAWLNTYLNSGEYWLTMLSDESKKKIYKEAIWNVGPSGQYQSNYSLNELIGESFEKKYQWIGKVGLLTKSEYMRACNYDIINDSSLCSDEKSYWTNSETCKDYNYLYKNANTYTLISPFYDRNNYRSDSRASTGRADFNTTNIVNGIRPVVFLNDNVRFSGKGTKDKPYEIYDVN